MAGRVGRPSRRVRGLRCRLKWLGWFGMSWVDLSGEGGSVGRPSRRAGRGREGREFHPNGQGFGSPCKRAGRSWESLTGAGSGRKALPECREGSEGPPGELGLVEKAGRCKIPILEGREGSVVLPGGQGGLGVPQVGPGRVRSPSRRTMSGWESLSEGLEGQGGPPGGLGGARMPSKRVVRGQETHPNGRRVWKPS